MFWFIYKLTLVVIAMIIIAVYFEDRELFKSQFLIYLRQENLLSY